MVFPLVEHLPYCTFNHIIKTKLRHLLIRVLVAVHINALCYKYKGDCGSLEP